MIFESHAHYEDEQFDGDRKELLESLSKNGIGCVVNVSSSLETIEKTLTLTRQYPFVYGAVGVHPEECGGLDEAGFLYVAERLKEPKVVALGEIGLDYHWEEPEKNVQKECFERQIAMAGEAGLPMIIHSRDAAKDTLDMMRETKAGETGGVVHCFSYGREMAREFLELGFYLGVGGVVTFPNARRLHEVVEYMPLDRLLLETDCPYLAPVPNRGKRNSSLNLIYVAERIAQLKGLDTEEVIRATEENARAMYRIPASD